MIPVRTLKCERFEMDYACFGKGRRILVILPGMSLHPVVPNAAFVARMFSCFTESHTVYLFDRKKNIQSGYSVFDMADDCVVALDMLSIVQADFYGASQGGMIAMTIAARYPSRVGKLALASTAAKSSAISTQTMNSWAEIARKGDPVELNRNIFSKVYSPSYYQRYRRAFEMYEDSGTAEQMRSFAILADATRSFDISGELGKITCPVFLAGVEDDTVLGSEGMDFVSEALHCPVQSYPGRGHAFYDEDRGFVEVLRKFFG